MFVTLLIKMFIRSLAIFTQVFATIKKKKHFQQQIVFPSLNSYFQ